MLIIRRNLLLWRIAIFLFSLSFPFPVTFCSPPWHHQLFCCTAFFDLLDGNTQKLTFPHLWPKFLICSDQLQLVLIFVTRLLHDRFRTIMVSGVNIIFLKGVTWCFRYVMNGILHFGWKIKCSSLDGSDGWKSYLTFYCCELAALLSGYINVFQMISHERIK